MQTDNPYASPAAINAPSTLVQPTGEIRPASQGKRFANLIIDNIFTTVLSSGAGFMAGAAYGLSRADPTAPLLSTEASSLQLFGNLLGFAVVMGYYILCEGLWQRTLGKLITGTCVIAANGGQPTWGQVVGRSFARIIPFEAFSFFGGEGHPVGWHDSLSKTRVVDVKSLSYRQAV